MTNQEEEITDNLKNESFRVKDIITSVFRKGYDYQLLGSCFEDACSEFFVKNITLEEILSFHEKLPEYSLSINSYETDLTRLFFFKK